MTVDGSVTFSEASKIPGSMYFSTTLGDIVDGNLFVGASASSSEAVTYIHLEAENVIISLDSLIGIGLTDNSISVTRKK